MSGSDNGAELGDYISSSHKDSERSDAAQTGTYGINNYDTTKEEEEEKRLFDSSRWWMASTAFPLIAGTFGPMANAFNICALGQNWRETFQGDEASGSLIKDPPWLLAVNAVSLAFALVGNISLLFNMAGRVRFGIAQPITITGFSVAAVLLIALVSRAAQPSFHQQGVAGSALTQAFYYACFAAGIYLLVAAMMLVTVVGSLLGRYEKRFNLTTPQRTLMLQTIVFLGYLMLGALIFSHLEHWQFLDALYWANFTLLTVGLGEPFVPVTHAGRSLLIPYAVGGIVAVGLTISSIRTMAVEQGKQKIFARMTEKDRVAFNQKVRRRLAKKPDSLDALSTRRRRQLEFGAMREIQTHSLRHAQWRALVMSLTAAFLLWFLGALVFMHTEYEQGWSYFEALYFSYVVLLTIGYGDLSPSSNSGKAFFVFWTLLAVPTLTILISDMSDTVIKLVSDATNWAGSLTILPGHEGGWSRFVRDVKRRSFWLRLVKRDPHSVLLRPEKHHDQHPRQSRHQHGFHVTSLKDDGKNHNDAVRNILQSRLNQDELHYCKSLESTQGHGAGTRDRHFYRWLLNRETISLLKDTLAEPPARYSYDEWAYFLALLGHDESSAQEPQLAQLAQPFHRQKQNVRLGHIYDSAGTPQPWSWLGVRSPLMSSKSEPRWLLQHMLDRLQRELHSQSLLADAESVPPIGLDALRAGPAPSAESG